MMNYNSFETAQTSTQNMSQIKKKIILLQKA